jgi:hypothetical protein
MAEKIFKMEAYQGFAVKYDSKSNPFFRLILEENLALIKKVPLGRMLLDLIGKASPSARMDFKAGINIMVEPVRDMNYVQSGHKLGFAPGSATIRVPEPSIDPRHVAPAGCDFYVVGGSKNAPKDPMAATTSKAGCVCTMYFSNAQMVTSKGERSYPHIVLAHELIHSYHCLYGIKKEGGDEELWTTGIEKFKDEPISENQFRSQFNLPLRTAYF